MASAVDRQLLAGLADGHRSVLSLPMRTAYLSAPTMNQTVSVDWRVFRLLICGLVDPLNSCWAFPDSSAPLLTLIETQQWTVQ